MLINDLSEKLTNHRDAIDQTIARVLDRSWLILGPEVQLFEDQFASYVGTKFCRSLANGTDALELALRIAGVVRDEFVATVANAGFYASTAILAVGALPRYMDVDSNTRVVTLSEVERAIHAGVKAVIVTHLYGLAVPEIAEISSACRAAGVTLIEDCAQAHGARLAGSHVGSFGDIGCFSFYPTKNLGALGDGGAIVTDSVSLCENVTRLREYGWQGKYNVVLEGARNSRMDEIQAAVLTTFLPHLDMWNEQRRKIAATYAAQITHPLVIQPRFGNSDEYVAHLYVVQTSQRASLQNHLRDCDVATDVHYPIPDHHQPLFAGQFDALNLPKTDLLSQEVLTLPCYPEMTSEQIQIVVSSVNAWKT